MRKQILIIDDSHHARQILRHQLEQSYQISEAPNGRDGMRLFDEIKPDGVILDLQMPFMDGRTVLQLLRAKNKTLPIIVLAANVQESTRQECQMLGATKLISKPFERTLVKETCQQLFTY